MFKMFIFFIYFLIFIYKNIKDYLCFILHAYRYEKNVYYQINEIHENIFPIRFRFKYIQNILFMLFLYISYMCVPFIDIIKCFFKEENKLKKYNT